MTILRTKELLAAGCFSVALIGTAQAGGFNRGTADTDILFEDGNAARAGVSIVVPNRGRDTFRPVGSPVSFNVSGYETPSYVIPSVAAKYKVNDAFACALTYTTPFGGHSDFRNLTGAGPYPAGYDPTSLTGSVEQDFVTHEFGSTCAYGFQMGKGKLSLLGGIFYQSLDFDQWVGGPGGPGHFKLSDGQVGWRIGAAYEIPDIAFRAQVMYRSGTDIDASGDLSSTASGTSFGPAEGHGKFPQSFEAKLQSGIAPGWLAYGSVKWTDWSVMDYVDYTIPVPGSPGTFSNNSLNFLWQDGWTVTAGVAHSFTDTLAGTVSLTWDRGVSTGHDIQSDVWTLGFGGSYKPNSNVEVRGGLGVLFLASGTQNYVQGSGHTEVSAPGVWHSDSDVGYAGSLSLAVKW
jgi:long-chain fatty acid transport protein